MCACVVCKLADAGQCDDDRLSSLVSRQQSHRRFKVIYSIVCAVFKCMSNFRFNVKIVFCTSPLNFILCNVHECRTESPTDKQVENTLDPFLARDVIYTSRAYATMSVSVCLSVRRLSVTEVYWRIIANIGLKFRSKLTAHCARSARCARMHPLRVAVHAGALW